MMRAQLPVGIAARLAAAGCVAPEAEAEVLVAAAPDVRSLEAWVRQREEGVPLPWITGRVRFAGCDLRIDAGVYVPRSHTEELARRATVLLARSSDKRAADLCTGSGAVAAELAASVPGAQIVGVDLDWGGARCAQRNRIPVVVGDVGAPLRSSGFDVVTAVAPYVPTGEIALLPADVQRYEPRAALDGGRDGLTVVRRIVRSAARLLRPGGWLLLELGGDEARLVSPVLRGAGFVDVEVWCHIDGVDRGAAARRPTPVLEPGVGIEPTASALQEQCSAS